jgi:hypothetical protein
MSEIEYAIFLGCKDYTNDIFWKHIFDDLSRGKLPRGVRMTSNHLSCSYKDKDFHYEFKGKPCSEIFNNIYELFTKRLNIYSQKDQYSRIEEMEEVVKEMEENRKEKWSSIRKKVSRYNLIVDYAGRMKKKYNTSIKESKRLINIIFTGLSLKELVSIDIEYKNGEIVNIKKIIFDGNRYCMLENITIPPEKKSKKKESQLSDLWPKYISGLNKNLFYNFYTE